MSQRSQDRQPLLPSHHSSGSRVAVPRISFPSATTSALAPTDEAQNGQEASSGQWPREPRNAGERQGLPKLSRECLWSEIKCYGSYILPVLIVFGVLVIGAGLGAVGWKRGWFG